MMVCRYSKREERNLSVVSQSISYQSRTPALHERPGSLNKRLSIEIFKLVTRRLTTVDTPFASMYA